MPFKQTNPSFQGDLKPFKIHYVRTTLYLHDLYLLYKKNTKSRGSNYDVLISHKTVSNNLIKLLKLNLTS